MTTTVGLAFSKKPEREREKNTVNRRKLEGVPARMYASMYLCAYASVHVCRLASALQSKKARMDKSVLGSVEA